MRYRRLALRHPLPPSHTGVETIPRLDASDLDGEVQQGVRLSIIARSCASARSTGDVRRRWPSTEPTDVARALACAPCRASWCPRSARRESPAPSGTTQPPMLRATGRQQRSAGSATSGVSGPYRLVDVIGRATSTDGWLLLPLLLFCASCSTPPRAPYGHRGVRAADELVGPRGGRNGAYPGADIGHPVRRRCRGAATDRGQLAAGPTPPRGSRSTIPAPASSGASMTPISALGAPCSTATSIDPAWPQRPGAPRRWPPVAASVADRILEVARQLRAFPIVWPTRARRGHLALRYRVVPPPKTARPDPSRTGPVSQK